MTTVTDAPPKHLFAQWFTSFLEPMLEDTPGPLLALQRTAAAWGWQGGWQSLAAQLQPQVAELEQRVLAAESELARWRELGDAEGLELPAPDPRVTNGHAVPQDTAENGRVPLAREPRPRPRRRR